MGPLPGCCASLAPWPVGRAKSGESEAGSGIPSPPKAPLDGTGTLASWYGLIMEGSSEPPPDVGRALWWATPSSGPSRPHRWFGTALPGAPPGCPSVGGRMRDESLRRSTRIFRAGPAVATTAGPEEDERRDGCAGTYEPGWMEDVSAPVVGRRVALRA